MKLLLETFFTLVFLGIFIACLPTIIGFLALCAIGAFILTVLKNIFADSEKPSERYSQTGDYETTDRKSEYHVTGNDRNGENRTPDDSSGISSSYRSSRYRYSCNDDYDNYYDDRYEDVPPEGGDGFRGTGAPFL